MDLLIVDTTKSIHHGTFGKRVLENNLLWDLGLYYALFRECLKKKGFTLKYMLSENGRNSMIGYVNFYLEGKKNRLKPNL